MLRKLVLFVLVVSVISSCDAGLADSVSSVLNTFTPSILNRNYGDSPKRLIYSFTNNDESNSSTREERGYLIKSPDSDKEELVVMGSYGTVDENGTETITMYKADRNGYQPMVKVRKALPNKALKTLAVG